MTVDVALLRKEVEWVEDEERRLAALGLSTQEAACSQDDLEEFLLACPPGTVTWVQGAWIGDVIGMEHCGTACCLAGHIGITTGVKFLRDITGCYSAVVENEDGSYQHVSDYARDCLGVTEPEAEKLFAGSNTAADIRRIAEEIAERAGDRL